MRRHSCRRERRRRPFCGEFVRSVARLRLYATHKSARPQRRAASRVEASYRSRGEQKLAVGLARVMDLVQRDNAQTGELRVPNTWQSSGVG